MYRILRSYILLKWRRGTYIPRDTRSDNSSCMTLQRRIPNWDQGECSTLSANWRYPESLPLVQQSRAGYSNWEQPIFLSSSSCTQCNGSKLAIYTIMGLSLISFFKVLYSCLVESTSVTTCTRNTFHWPQLGNFYFRLTSLLVSVLFYRVFAIRTIWWGNSFRIEDLICGSEEMLINY